MSHIYTDINQVTPTIEPLTGDEKAVIQSVMNILNTSRKERIFLPQFGSALDFLIGEPIDDITSRKVYRLIIEDIDNWEPRVRLNYGASQVIPLPLEHKYDITLVFIILGLDRNVPVSLRAAIIL